MGGLGEFDPSPFIWPNFNPFSEISLESLFPLNEITWVNIHWLFLEEWPGRILDLCAQFSAKFEVWYITINHQLRCDFLTAYAYILQQ